MARAAVAARAGGTYRLPVGTFGVLGDVPIPVVLTGDVAMLGDVPMPAKKLALGDVPIPSAPNSSDAARNRELRAIAPPSAE
jgi:hypothetical protein